MHFTEMYIERRTLSIIPILQNSHENLSFVNCLTCVFLILLQFKGAKVFYYYYLKLTFSSTSPPNFKQKFTSKLQNKAPKKQFSAETWPSTYWGNTDIQLQCHICNPNDSVSPIHNTRECQLRHQSWVIFHQNTCILCLRQSRGL